MNWNWIRIKNSLYDAWNNAPSIRAATTLAALLFGLVILNYELPDDLAVDFSTPKFKEYSWMFILVIYFLLFAVFSGDRLRLEKKLREMEQNFKYDNRGTLLNGSEPNIAFRIATFKALLSEISLPLGRDEAARLLEGSGRKASNDFGTNLKSIYDSDVLSKKVGNSWEELSLSDKLATWADYDSATGWGIISAKLSGTNVKVTINHLYELFEGDGGDLFGHFLAGYTENIIGITVNEHHGGIYDEYTGCELSTVSFTDKFALQLEYTLV